MFHPLQLRHNTIDTPLFMAPVAGVCNIPFRVIAREQGCPNIFTEMVSSEALSRHIPKTVEFLRVGAEERLRPFVQLFGANPAAMAQSARICTEEGFTLIDINMGCPVKKVVRSGSGVELMQHPQLAGEIVSQMVAAAGACADITVKTRLGLIHGDELLPELALQVQQAGASMLTVHARTRSDGFGGQARWHEVAPIKSLLHIPLIINGDITDYPSACLAMEQSRADGAMIAREGYTRPWIFREILSQVRGQATCEPTPRQIREILLRHLDLLCQYMPERAHILMRKHGSWYSKGTPGSSEFRQALNSCTDSAQVRSLISTFAAS